MVISACESGIGEIVRGEGLLGFTRGFIYSGAKNLIVSLWEILDGSTADIMIDFYKRITSGDNYLDALRNSKLHLIDNTNYCPPRYWAPFVLIGK